MPATAAGEDLAAADASARGTAGALVLALYGHIPVDSLQLGGDRGLFNRLIARDPDEQDVTMRHPVCPKSTPPANGCSHAVVPLGCR